MQRTSLRSNVSSTVTSFAKVGHLLFVCLAYVQSQIAIYILNLVRQPNFCKTVVGCMCFHSSCTTIFLFVGSMSSQLLSSGFGTHSSSLKSLAYLLKALLPKLKVNSYSSCPVCPVNTVIITCRLSLIDFFEYSFSLTGSKTPSHQKFLIRSSFELLNTFVISYSRKSQKSWSNIIRVLHFYVQKEILPNLQNIRLVKK